MLPCPRSRPQLHSCLICRVSSQSRRPRQICWRPVAHEAWVDFHPDQRHFRPRCHQRCRFHPSPWVSLQSLRPLESSDGSWLWELVRIRPVSSYFSARWEIDLYDLTALLRSLCIKLHSHATNSCRNGLTCENACLLWALQYSHNYSYPCCFMLAIHYRFNAWNFLHLCSVSHDATTLSLDLSSCRWCRSWWLYCWSKFSSFFQATLCSGDAVLWLTKTMGSPAQFSCALMDSQLSLNLLLMSQYLPDHPVSA